jgi:glutamate N-acetyltransferase / amino-acid N-acetyltransferase
VAIIKIKGGVTAAAGYKASGVAGGIKKSGGKDVAMVVSEAPAKAYGMFTTNKVKAAPVVVSMKNIASSKISGVVITSGNANACTGAQGLNDAKIMCEAAGEFGFGGKMLVASTGVIGQYLPMDKVIKGIEEAGNDLSETGSRAAAEAIMTTDTVVKESAVEIEVGKKTVRIGGMAKGVGMIAPNMATMIALITTDADICKKALEAATRESVEASFNCVTIDGDMSTNDTVFVLANGAAGNTHILLDSHGFESFKEGLETVMADLAEQMVRDGEEATKFVRVTVNGGDCYDTAKNVAMKVADSLLVKCALYGEDANWGRIAAAAGSAEGEFNPEEMAITINGLVIMKEGGASIEDQTAVDAAMKEKDIFIVIDLKEGRSSASILTTDLSVGYVKFNAHYRT